MLVFHQKTDFHAHPLYVNGNIILQVKYPLTGIPQEYMINLNFNYRIRLLASLPTFVKLQRGLMLLMPALLPVTKPLTSLL